MWRPGRRMPRPAVVATEGDLVIEGRVRARLLRLPLLDIEAHVVVTPARPPLTSPRRGRALAPARDAVGRPARDAVGRPGARAHGRMAPPRRRPALGPGHPAAPELGRAEQLIAEATSILHDASRLA